MAVKKVILGSIFICMLLGVSAAIFHIISIANPEIIQSQQDIKECQQNGLDVNKEVLESCVHLLELDRRLKRLSESLNYIKFKIVPGIDI